MKTLLKVALFALILSCFGGLIINCRNDCNDDTQYYKLGKDTLMVSHVGNEVYKFLRITPNDTDTVTYFGQGRKDYIDTGYWCDECCLMLLHDIQELNYYTGNNSENLKIVIHGGDGFYNFSSKVQIYFKSKTFEAYLDGFPQHTGSDYFQSISFYNKTYHSVYRSLWSEYNVDDSVYISYYSGIIRISFSKEHYSLTRL